MEDFKIDYVERIKALLEKKDYAGLDKFLLKINKHIEGDQEFNELISEIKGKDYVMAISIAEEMIYENSNEDLEFDDYKGGDDDDDDDSYGFNSLASGDFEGGGDDDRY